MTRRRVGLLGGAFNPPHLGHLKLARLALDELALDELRFVPAGISPLKPMPEGTPEAATRLRLLREALAGLDGPFSIESLELERPGVSYTVETLETLTAREPGNAWIWVVGEDQLARFPRWHLWERILELGSLAVGGRPGAAAEVPEPLRNRLCGAWSGAPGEIVRLSSTGLELSSTRLREDIAAGEASEGVPIQVRAAIGRENLYR